MIQNETNERPATTGIVHGQVYVKGTNYEWVDCWDSREMMRRFLCVRLHLDLRE